MQKQSSIFEWLTCLAGILFLAWVCLIPLRPATTPPGQSGHNQTNKAKASPRKNANSAKKKDVQQPVTTHVAKFAGPGSCAKCHPKIAGQFAESRKAKSLTRIESVDLEQSGPVVDAQEDRVARLSVNVRDRSILHRESIQGTRGGILIDRSIKAEWAVGSGKFARAYLVGKELRLSPIVWFAQRKQWRLLNDHVKDYAARFETAMPARCWSCHAARQDSERVEPGASPYALHALSCESCHGPSAEHVQGAQNKKPQHGTFRSNDTACMLCHVSPNSRVPVKGKSIVDLVAGPNATDSFAVVNSPDNTPNPVVELLTSRCFKESKGKLSCLNCHDAHTSHSGRDTVEHYRTRCMSCHDGPGKTSCKVPLEKRRQQQPDDSCLACHMPARAATTRFSLHGHGHNHFINRFGESLLVRPGQKLDRAHVLWKSRVAGMSSDSITVEKWIDSPRPTANATWKQLSEKSRDLRDNQPDLQLEIVEAAYSFFVGDFRDAAIRLAAIVPRRPNDGWLRTMYAIALLRANQSAEAERQIDEALKRLQQRSGPLLVQAWIRQANGNLKGAIESGEKSLAVNPRRWATRRWLKQAYQTSGNLPRMRLMEAFLKRVGQN